MLSVICILKEDKETIMAILRNDDDDNNNSNDNNNNNNNSNNYRVIITELIPIITHYEYWVDVQQGIVSSHGKRDP